MNTSAELTKTIEDHGYASVTTVKGIVAVEEYKGIEIKISFNSAEWIYTDESRADHLYTSLCWNTPIFSVSGTRMESGAKSISDLADPKRIAKAIAAAKKAIDRHLEDEAIRSELAGLAGAQFETRPASSRMPQVGDVAALFSRGSMRFGIVTAIGPKNIEIAYVTRGGLDEEAKTNGRVKATITRKAQPISAVAVLA
jgi:hypothetical protein